jgi:hypothetical protein
MHAFDLVFRERRSGWAAAYERNLQRRMLLAVATSVALHVAITSSFEWTEIFHAEKAEGQPLRARIAPLKPVAAVEAPPAIVPVAPRPRPKPLPKLPTAADAVLPAKPAAKPEPPPVVAAAEPAPVEAPKPEPVVEAAKPEPAAPATAPEPPGSGQPIAFPERIDLEFNLLQGAGGGPVGRVVHRFERQGERYLIRSTHELTGIGVLFNAGKFVQESQGAITAKGLRPDRFSVLRGRSERNQVAAFDWGASKATLTAGGNSREWDLKPGAQDMLSIIHQLSFMVGDAALPGIWITDARRFDTVSLEFLGKESVDTDLGATATLRYRYQARDDRLRCDLWLAPDYGNLPMKIRLRDRRGEEIEWVLSNMKVR